MMCKTDNFHLHRNTELYTIIFLYTDSTAQTKEDGLWLRDTLDYYSKTGCTCRNGHFEGKTSSREKKVQSQQATGEYEGNGSL